MLNQIYAIKEQMHQEFIGGKRTPITLLTVPEHQVLSEKTIDRDGYRALVVGVGKGRPSEKKSLLGFLKKAGSEVTPKKIREILLPENETVTEKTLALETLLTPGTLVSVTAKSKGKGFAGAMKRWGFHGGPRTHGQSDRARAVGSVARGTTPGRIIPGKRMPGHMGDVNKSVANLKVVAFDAATGKLKLSGPVPGNKQTLVTIKITKPAASNQ